MGGFDRFGKNTLIGGALLLISLLVAAAGVIASIKAGNTNYFLGCSIPAAVLIVAGGSMVRRDLLPGAERLLLSGGERTITAEVLGNEVLRLYDVGVSGIHRLLSNMEAIMSARVIVAVAGMEGALPSVIGGLADCPVIAVPTSVGYGASLGGIAALLSMLNSCASGVSVVNIDNGFGAGYMASMINHLD